MVFKDRDDDGEVEEEFTSKKEGSDDARGEATQDIMALAATVENNMSPKKQEGGVGGWGVRRLLSMEEAPKDGDEDGEEELTSEKEGDDDV